MSANIIFYLHPHEELLQGHLLSSYASWHAAEQRESAIRRVLWLAPSLGACHELEQLFLEKQSGTVVSPWFMTFDEFANKLLASSELNVFPISPFEQSLLIREVVERLHLEGTIQSVSNLISRNSFISYITRFITEMKRDEIWPVVLHELRRREQSGNKSAKLKSSSAYDDLVTIYDAYQQELIASEHYDAQGRFWSARELLVRGHRGPFKQLTKIVVHGFQDFTASQKSILTHLATFLNEIHLSLPLEFPLRRGLLFAKVQSTFNSLKAGFGSVDCKLINHPVGHQQLKPAAEVPKGLQQLRANLFCVPTEFNPIVEHDGIEILAVAGHRGENYEIIARIKKLLLSGVRPDKILVVFRQMDEGLVGFARLAEKSGLPVSCEAYHPLSETPIYRALQSLLNLELNDWNYSDWANILTARLFFNDSDQNDAIHLQFLRVLRELNMPGGRREIVRALEQHLNYEAARTGSPIPDHWTMKLKTFLQRLELLLSPFRKPQTFDAWVDLIIHTMNSLWKPVVDHPFAKSDKQDWDLLVGVLKDSVLLERRLSHDDLQLSLAQFAIRLEVLMQTKSPGRFASTRSKGTIRILSAEEGRHVSTEYMFMLDLTQDQYTARASREDWEELKSQTNNYQQKPLEDLLSEEQLLFYSLCVRAKKQLTLSYAATNAAGEPLSPSPCVVSLLTLFKQAGQLIQYSGSLDPVEQADWQLNAEQQRLMAIKQLRWGEGGFLKQLTCQLLSSRMANNQLSALETLYQRNYQPGLTKFEGELAGIAPVVSLLTRLFPAHHQFSATQLEGYLSCPYRFMVQQLMSIKPLSIPGLQNPQQRRGNIIHDVFASQHQNDLGELTSTFAERLKEFLTLRLGREVAWNDMQMALLEVEQHVLNRWCEEHLKNQEAYQQSMQNFDAVPTTKFVELSFGSAVPSSADQPDMNKQPQLPPVAFGDDQHKVLLRGRIDRIDAGKLNGEDYFNIVDYKSGNVTGFDNKLQNKQGYQIQLVMYAIAAVRLGIIPQLDNVYQVGYWKVKGGGFSSGKSRAKVTQPLGPEVMADFAAELDRLIPMIVESMRAGHFPVFNRRKECTANCSYHTICRINEVRSRPSMLNKVFDVDPLNVPHEEDEEADG